MTRRELVASFASAASATALAAQKYSPKIVMQTYVWTQHLRNEKQTLAQGLESIFAGGHEAGFKRIEIMDAFLTAELGGRTVEYLRKYRLEAPVVYHGAALHEEAVAEKTVAEILEFTAAAKPAGCAWINVNTGQKAGRARKSDQELETQITYLNRLGRGLRERGFRLMIHQHDPEMADNAREWRSFLRTDPSLVWICLDTHWVYRGKQDPMALLREGGRRLASVHLRNSQQGIWTEDLGEGDLNHADFARFLRGIGFDGFLVVELAYDKETRITRPITRSLEMSRAYVEKVFGVKA